MILDISKLHKCEKLTQIGIWEGIDSSDNLTSGPEVRCDDCGLEFRVTWNKWNDLSDKNKKVERSIQGARAI